jgi:hydroxyethylthiazole kinase-like uncharacterized protein yjeF
MELRIWTAAEAARRDREAEARGVDPGWLLEAAGSAVARWLRQGGASRVAVLAGPGKNGGDGLVAARRLAEQGVAVGLYAPDGVRFAGGTRWLEAARGAGVHWVDEAGWPGVVAASDWVVDAGFGTGLNRPLGEGMGRALHAIGEAGRPVVAVDLPSGVDADTGRTLGPVVPARATITFDAVKPAHAFGPAVDDMGEVVVAAIGLPPAPGDHYRVMNDLEVAGLLPGRAAAAHKYAAGRLAVIAGSETFAGAAGLTALAAFRAGAGYVECWTDARVRDRLRFLPAVVRALPRGAAGTLTLSEDARARLAAASAVVVGPGLGRVDPTLVEFLRATGRPTVVDAEAMAAWKDAGAHPWPEAVFTPHAGEAATLLGQTARFVEAHRAEALAALVALTGATVVLKGPRTLVGAPAHPVWVNWPGGPELATAGTGDVLAGVLGALLAAGRPLPLAAAAATFWHGVSGEQAARRLGSWSVTARDVADGLGPAARSIVAGYRPERWPSLWI